MLENAPQGIRLLERLRGNRIRGENTARRGSERIVFGKVKQPANIVLEAETAKKNKNNNKDK